MDIVCPKCGYDVPLGSTFCIHCGEDLEAFIQSSPPPSSNNPVTAIPTTAENTHDLLPPEVHHPEFHHSETPRYVPVQPLAHAEDRIHAAEERIDHETAETANDANHGGWPIFEYDRLCMLFENLPGTVRMRFNPNRIGSGIRNVKVSFQSMLNGETVSLPTIAKVNMVRPMIAQFPAQPPGQQSWLVRVEYEEERRKKTLEGQIEILVIRPEETKQAATNLSISIDNSVRIGDHSANAADIATRGGLFGGQSANAADIQMRSNLAKALDQLTRSHNPFDELRSIIQSDNRAWTKVELFDADIVDTLPPIPANARTDRIALEIGGRIIHFFANRTVKFGRKRECNDFVLRPPKTYSEAQEVPYRRVSREHCYFEHSGGNVLISDGSRSPAGVIQPSSVGTFWNGQKMVRPVEVPSGTSGILSIGGMAFSEALKMKLQVCDSIKACAACPLADRSWSGDGSRPCLMISRTDGVEEKFIALWSCFWLGEADPSFEGYVVFRKDGAFAYCCEDGRVGWFVPGTTVQTDFGNMTVN